MFVGRTAELSRLEKASKREKATLVVCRGRRRIGKSTLIQKFGETVTRFYEFQGLPPREISSNADQLANFSRAMAEAFFLPSFRLESWHDAFSLLANQTAKGKVVILLDEISWMASHDRDFAGHLKIAWDTKLKRNNHLTLVLCGSVSSWIDKNILHSAGFMGRVSLTITLEELSLALCNEFWGTRKDRISAMEKFKLLSITGGVPRYLEEINPGKSAEHNIQRLCFHQSGILFNEFEQIFEDTFGRRAGMYRNIVAVLADGPRTFSEICKRLGVDPNGVISTYLGDLEESGFIARDYVYSPKSVKKGKLSRFRLRDNYIRFYLKYIDPQRERIRAGFYDPGSVEDLPGYETIMGLQLENLVLNNLKPLLVKLRIPFGSVRCASPYFQNRTARQKACQVDLLIQTRNTLYVCEIKFRKKVDTAVVAEMKEKLHRLKYNKTTSVRPVLIHAGELAQGIEASDFFDAVISLDELLKT
ncbi:ATP-binding protein [Acidobacteriota bacterium]